MGEQDQHEEREEPAGDPGVGHDEGRYEPEQPGEGQAADPADPEGARRKASETAQRGD